MTHSRPDRQWVLAFNASCQNCRVISGAVAEASGEKLTVLPLTQPDVVRWRTQALGADAPWAPTLVRAGADDEEVRAWTGTAMAVPMVRCLGVRSALAVLRELGRLKRQEDAAPADQRALSRKSFLRLGTGAAVAVGLMVGGRTPAFARGATDEVRSWVEANKDRLPQTYDEVIAHPMEYRRAIYRELPADVRRELWLEQLRRYQAGQPKLTTEQNAVLAAAAAYGAGATAADSETGMRLMRSSINAFGKDEARALFGTLGPEPESSASPASVTEECNCSVDHSWCWVKCQHTGGNGCTVTPDGCGWWWDQRCNGLCL